MITELDKQTVQSNNEAKEVKFTPTENGLLHLIDVVANKQYKNPIKSLMIEYVQNALDSHDQAGTSETPIEITIPSKDHPYFEVRDYGIGMTNKEVVSILSKIGFSTKNHSNDLRGGFGLGKLVFSSYHTKTMLISNFTNGERNDWVARLGGGEGGITPLGKTKTNEKQGLHIKIPVRQEDVESFQSYSCSLYNYITPEPVIKNYEFHNFHRSNVVEKGSNWIISDNNREFIATMGGLCFPIEWNNINTPNFEVGYGNTYGMVLHFNIGELDIVSSRDSLDYGPEKKTIPAIKKRLEEIEEEYVKEYSKFKTLTVLEKKSIIRDLIEVRSRRGILAHFKGAFYETNEVKDFIKEYPMQVKWENHVPHSEKKIYFNNFNTLWRKVDGRYTYVVRCPKEFEAFYTYAPNYYVFVDPKLSLIKFSNVLNKTEAGRKTWEDRRSSGSSVQTNNMIIARTQEDLDKFLTEHAIDKNLCTDVNSFLVEYSKISKDVSSDTTPHKVYTLRGAKVTSYRPSFSFTCVDFSDPMFDNKDAYIWTNFYRYGVGHDQELAEHTIKLAVEMNVIKKEDVPTVLCFNALAVKKYKPQNTYKSVDDYIKELKKKISKAVNDREGLIFDYCVSTKYVDTINWQMLRYLKMHKDKIVNPNLIYIFKAVDDTSNNSSSGKYTGIESHSNWEKIKGYADNFVTNVLTETGLRDYDSLVNKLIEEKLKSI